MRGPYLPSLQCFVCHIPVFRIHDILGWIRILGSMLLTNGSGFGSGSWIRILLFSSLPFNMPFTFTVHHFSKIKSQKESQNRRNRGFSYYFCMMIEGSGAGSGSIPLTSGSGSGSWRPENMWIRWIRSRLRIRNTVTYMSFV
jgi:hypothetical protein